MPNKVWRTVNTMSPHILCASPIHIAKYSTVDKWKLKTKPVLVNRTSESPVPVQTLCRFASLSYCKPSVIERKCSESDSKDPGWICLSTGRSECDGYFGVAFWHEEDRQLVIAHRGTVNLRDALGADLEGIINRQHTQQIHSASYYASLVLADFKNIDCDVTIIGHSLGGWLAPLSAFEVKYLRFEGDLVRHTKKYEKEYNPYIVTFDAPGCLTDLGKLVRLYFYEQQTRTIVTSISKRLINYCITPNLINTTNSHIGEIRSFKKCNRQFGFDYHFSVVDRALFSLLTHSFDSFLYIFEHYPPSKFTSYKASEWPKKNRLLALLPSLWVLTPWKMLDNIFLVVELVFGIIHSNKLILQFELPPIVFEKYLSDIDF